MRLLGRIAPPYFGIPSHRLRINVRIPLTLPSGATFLFVWTPHAPTLDPPRRQFNEGMAELTCCGVYAPFVCTCDSEAYRIFQPDGGVFGGVNRFDVSFEDFMERIIELNMSNLVGGKSGGCMQTVTATVLHGASLAATPPSLPRLFSQHGEVVVTLNQAGTPLGPDWDILSNTTFTGASNVALDGFRLAREDAKRLMDGYGAQYGDRGSTGHALIVIDVSILGKHHSRWFYATNPVYLALDPSTLGFLSFKVSRASEWFVVSSLGSGRRHALAPHAVPSLLLSACT